MAKKEIFKKDYIQKVQELYELGATEFDIAKILKTNVRTIARWRKAHPLFDEVIRNGRRDIDKHVASALLKRMCGYDKDEVTVTQEFDADGQPKGGYTVKTVTKHYAPDLSVSFAWLKSRWPEFFKENKIPEHETPEIGDIEKRLKELDKRRNLLDE